MAIEFTTEETGTVLAALRNWQRLLDRQGMGIATEDPIASDGGMTPLTPDAIDSLCMRINVASKEDDEDRDQEVVDLAHELFDDDHCTVEHNAKMAIAEDDGAAWVQCWRLIGAETLRENGIVNQHMEPDESGQEEE